jgi:phenolic acid decarboxylase
MSLSKFKVQTTPLMSAKGLLTYNLMHGITFMKKYIENEHEAQVCFAL